MKKLIVSYTDELSGGGKVVVCYQEGVMKKFKLINKQQTTKYTYIHINIQTDSTVTTVTNLLDSAQESHSNITVSLCHWQ